MTSHALSCKKHTGLAAVQDVLAFLRDPLQFCLDIGREAALAHIYITHKLQFWIVTDPDLCREVLQTKVRNFPRDRRLRQRQEIETFETVFNAPTWDEWLWRRRLLQPAFHARELAKFGSVMVTEAVQMIAEIDLARPVDMVWLMKTLTMRIICQTMFSASLQESDAIQDSFDTTTAFRFRRAARVINLPLWWPTKKTRAAKAAAAVRRQIIARLVQERLASGQAKGDLLDMLISAHLDEDGRQFTGDDLVSEMISIVFAGHETTAMILVWFFYTLTQRPDIEKRVLAEIDIVLNGRCPTLDDLEQMPYTHCVLLETLRLYPSVYVTLREAESVDELDGHPIAAGARIILNIRALQRSGRYWSHPDEFRPERFDSEKGEAYPKFAFIPFIAGPKKCIGDQFAMMEMRLVVATLLQKYRFSYISPRPAKEKAWFVMGAEEAVLMRVGERI